MTTQVTYSQNEIQNTSTDSIRLSSTGSFTGSTTAWIVDSLIKIYRVFVSPSANYGIAGSFSESKMDFNSKGGLVVGKYGIAEGKGTINPNSVNDVVGVHCTAVKRTNCWSTGVHADVYDYAAGGVGIGVNIEFPVTYSGNRYIGINAQPNTACKYEGLNLQGSVSTAFNTSEGTVDKLLSVNSASPMWTGNGSPGGALGNYAGSLKITIDGSDFHIPVYK